MRTWPPGTLSAATNSAAPRSRHARQQTKPARCCASLPTDIRADLPGHSETARPRGCVCMCRKVPQNEARTLRYPAEIRGNLATSQQICAPGRRVGAVTVLDTEQFLA